MCVCVWVCVFASLHPLSLSPLHPSPPSCPPPTPKLHPTPMASAHTSLQAVLLAYIRIVQSAVQLASQLITHRQTHVNTILCKPRSFEKRRANITFWQPQQTTLLLALMQEIPGLPFLRLADAECWALESSVKQTEQSSLLATASIDRQEKWEEERFRWRKGAVAARAGGGGVVGWGGQEWEDRRGGGLVGIIGDGECWTSGWGDHKGSRRTP